MPQAEHGGTYSFWKAVAVHNALQIVLKNGDSYEKFIGAPTGSAIKPLNEQSLFNKFQSCIKYSEVNFDIEDLYEKLSQIQSINNCSELF